MTKVWCINAYANEITTTGFTIHIDTWNDTLLYCGAGYWVAYLTGKAQVTSGRYHTDDIRTWENPHHVNNGRVDFGGEFASKPQVLLGINNLDMSCEANLRLKVKASQITEKGMTW